MYTLYMYIAYLGTSTNVPALPLDTETYHHFYYVFPPYYRYILSLLVSRVLY